MEECHSCGRLDVVIGWQGGLWCPACFEAEAENRGVEDGGIRRVLGIVDRGEFSTPIDATDLLGKTDGGVADVVHKAVQLDVLAEYIREHTAARGVDLWAVEEMGQSASQWAGMTDRDRSTVSRNVRRAKNED